MDQRRSRKRGPAAPGAAASGPAAPGATASGYTEGVPEAAAYVLTALLIIGLGVWLGSVVLNWIVGPALAIVLVLVLTPLCRRVRVHWVARRNEPA